MTKRILVKDVYAELLVLVERVDNLREDVKQDRTRIENLEYRYQNAINNELAHLKKALGNRTNSWTRKDAGLISTLIITISVLVRILEHLITKGLP